MVTMPLNPSPAKTSQETARLYDYRQAANPVRPGLTEPIGYHRWSPELHATGPTAILPLDISDELGCEGPATSPALAAHFLRILSGESLKAAANATSSLFVVLRGQGSLVRPPMGTAEGLDLAWGQGDVVVLAAGGVPLLQASEESVLFWVHDGPLLRHLGVEATVRSKVQHGIPRDQRQLFGERSDPAGGHRGEKGPRGHREGPRVGKEEVSFEGPAEHAGPFFAHPETRAGRNAIVPNASRLILVLGDQLDAASAAFDGFDAKQDVVWMAEVKHESAKVWSTKARIAVFLAAMRHVRAALEQERIPVDYTPLTARPAAGDEGPAVRPAGRQRPARRPARRRPQRGARQQQRRGAR
jgi:hypothetical protein